MLHPRRPVRQPGLCPLPPLRSPSLSAVRGRVGGRAGQSGQETTALRRPSDAAHHPITSTHRTAKMPPGARSLRTWRQGTVAIGQIIVQEEPPPVREEQAEWLQQRTLLLREPVDGRQVLTHCELAAVVQ